jgi:hypothetical protein
MRMEEMASINLNTSNIDFEHKTALVTLKPKSKKIPE